MYSTLSYYIVEVATYTLQVYNKSSTILPATLTYTTYKIRY